MGARFSRLARFSTSCKLLFSVFRVTHMHGLGLHRLASNVVTSSSRINELKLGAFSAYILNQYLYVGLHRTF